jgi:FlaA1/EpsC-like NDP-sugar epimerase
MGLHLLIFSAGYFFAFALRLDFEISLEMQKRFWISLPVVVGIEVVCFLLFKTFHGWWRYVTFRDLISFVNPFCVSFLAILAVDTYILNIQIPRSILLINILTSGLLMTLVRSSWRLANEGLLRGIKTPDGYQGAFMISNHFDSLVVANQINSQQNSTTRIVGILCTDKKLRGSKRAGIPILGGLNDAPRLASKHGVNQVWLIAGSLSGCELADLKQLYDQYDIETKVIPAAIDRNPGSSFVPVREIKITDLLQRSPIELDNQRIQNEIAGKCVMVTGAGGSIGSEICRQLLKFGPSDLVLVDHRENSVFLIHNELMRLPSNETTLHPAVADILDSELMSDLFGKHSPEFVYHAAAHKHVGLMERQPSAAVRNNIIGTRQLADMASSYEVTKFVMVSTDKAVNPTSIMGCSKQIAERYCLSMSSHSQTKFIVVRFGNVLGSNGSVVPIFKEQIERGGPITITDERMTRFFMTIPEASQLVLQAGSMGNGGEIFVLDMGEQVKIVDLAKKMIRLAGLPDSAIEIRTIGARPGEKMYEELYFEEEEMIPTDHVKIFAANHRTLDFTSVSQCIQQFENACSEGPDDIRALLKNYIPEYQTSDNVESQDKVETKQESLSNGKKLEVMLPSELLLSDSQADMTRPR